MQRQSLGSPGRTSGVGTMSTDDIAVEDHLKRRESSPSSSSSAAFSGDIDDEIKPEKPLRRCHSQKPEKFIHLIPILMLLCFLILYLSSHDPSPSDMAGFKVFKHPEKIIDATDIDDIGRVDDNKLKNNGVFSIRSLRNLQEEIEEVEEEDDEDTAQKSRSHRKLGDF